jgi:hypothetical protein
MADQFHKQAHYRRQATRQSLHGRSLPPTDAGKLAEQVGVQR